MSYDPPSNPYVTDAINKHYLLKDGNKTFFTEVWPKNATFLDWFNPNASRVWAGGLSDLDEEFE